MEKPKRKNVYYRTYEAGQASDADMLMEMFRDKEAKVRAEVARNPNATPEIMMMALNDPNKDVRSSAAKNPKATEEVLLKALENEYFDVKWDASSNPAATHNVLKKALEIDDDAIRFRVSGNESIDMELLRITLEDSDSYVRQNAANSLLKMVKKKSEEELKDILSGNKWHEFTQMMAADPVLRLLVIAKLSQKNLLEN